MSEGLTKLLSVGRVRDLASLLLKAEHLAPSRRLVEPLLELLVGGHFDMTQNQLIMEPGVILVMLEILPSLSNDLQLELWSVLGAILHQNLTNTHICQRLNLIERCLDHLAKTKNPKVAGHITNVAETLASYSISVKELKAILSYLYTSHTDKHWAPNSVLLIGALNNISVNLQPEVFFSFSGIQGGVIALPPLSQWPAHPGFTLSTWLRMEKPHDAKKDYYKPVVYWFRTGRGVGLGYSAHFNGSFLVLETVSKHFKKPQTHVVDCVFHSYQWYMLTVVYEYRRLRQSEVRCYVDSQLVLTAEVSLPSTDEVYDKCFLGGSPSATPETTFQGQLAAVYLWNDPMKPQVISSLYKLGPSYKSRFRFEAEVDIPLSSSERKLLFDGSLANSLIISYNAKAVDGKLCLESSPAENKSYFIHSPHATMLEGVEPIVNPTFPSALHSLGGVQAFFPLFSQLDLPQAFPSQDAPSSMDYCLSMKLLLLVFEVGRNSLSSMFQLVQTKAFELISYLLEEVSPAHLTEDLLSTIFDCVRYLSVIPNAEELLRQLIEHLLFNPRLWVRAKDEVQIQLYSQVVAEFCLHRLGTSSHDLRNLVGVPFLMFVLKEHYSVTQKPHNSEIRPYILLMVKQFVTRGKGIEREELQSILDYLSAVPEEENVLDVLKLLTSLAFEEMNTQLIRLIRIQDGLNVAVKLLACSMEELRLQSLKLINKVVHELPSKEQMVEINILFTVIREKLLTAGQPVTLVMFNTLIELLLNLPSTQMLESRLFTVEADHKIVFIDALPVLTELISTLGTTGSSSQNHAMRSSLLAYIYSLCSRSSNNCKAVLDLVNWQYWLLVLADYSQSSSEEYNALQSQLHDILHILMVHSFSEKSEGWKVWVDTTTMLNFFRTEKQQSQKEPGGMDEGVRSSSDLLRKFDSPQIQRHSLDSRTHTIDSPVIHRHSTGSPVKSQCIVDSTALRRSSMDSPLLQSQKLNRERLMSGSTESNTIENQPAVPESEEHAVSCGEQVPTEASASVSKDVSIRPKSATSSQKKKCYNWSSEEMKLLERLQNSLLETLGRVSHGILGQLMERQSSHIMYNIGQMLALTVDCWIGRMGGIKALMSEFYGASGKDEKKQIKQSAKNSAVSPELLLRQSLQLSNSVILSGHLKTYITEDQMRMEPGGIARLCLRVVMDVLTLDCISASAEFSDKHSHYHQHKSAVQHLQQHSVGLMTALGIKGSHLHEYLNYSLKNKQKALKGCQVLLSEDELSLLDKTLPRDLEARPVLNSMVSCILYFLSALSVAKYKKILDSSKRSSSDTPSGSSTVSIASSCEAPAVGAMQGTTSLVHRTESQEDSVESSLGSATDLRDMSHENAATFVGAEDFLQSSTLLPSPHTIDVSEQIDTSLKLVGSFLCRLLTEHRSMLGKVLVGTDGRQLLSEAVLKLAESNSVVEITMLISSQEWQASLKKSVGKQFNSLIAEGRRIAQLSESYLNNVRAKCSNSIKMQRDTEMENFTTFEERVSLYLSDRIKHLGEDTQRRRAEVLRCTLSAEKHWRKVSPMVDNCGSFDFTPLKPSLLWKLDLREDCKRRRLKLLPNPTGIAHAEAARIMPEELPTIENEISQELSVPAVSMTENSEEEGMEGADEDDDANLSLEATYSETSEVPQVILQCKMVAMAYLLPGSLSFTAHTLTFNLDDNNFKPSILIDCCPLNERWNLLDVRAVLTRRYLHQNKALEIFFSNKSSIFLVFENQREVRKVVGLLPRVGIGASYGLPQSRAISLASPQQLFRRSSMTDKWVKREISNFDYLMFLNTIAGRSYNDLSQYHIFPWILSDYSSETIDLQDTSVYRDLFKPIGALKVDRARQFQERYENWDSDVVPAFHYGTHFSTLAFVLHWLVRVEPFTTLHIDLHDGYFDHGSRMFSSIPRAWNNCQQDTSDVKELIPELFVFPEMFTNHNKFVLGWDEHCEEGENPVINNVILPPWAKSPEHFIQLHRKALESEHVSSTLHGWIDLIFGFKQRGKAAEDAINTFYHITYPDSVDWDAITDEKQLKAIEQQVLQFGQTPVQLLSQPHPQRQPPGKEVHIKPVSELNPAIVSEIQVALDIPVSLIHLSPSTSSLLVVTYNQLYSINKWDYTPAKANNQPPVISLDPDPYLATRMRMSLGEPLDQRISVSQACFSTTPTGDIIFVCGYWDNSFKSFSADTGQLLQSIFGHKDLVTCMNFSMSGGLYSAREEGIIATGSLDTTVMLWKWNGRINRIISALHTPQASLTSLAILNGHEQPVNCVAVSAGTGLVVSGAKSGCCLLHSTSGELLHKLVPSSPWTHPHMISSASNGHFVLHYADQKGCLGVFTCNGKQLAYRALSEPALAMTVSGDGDYVIIGGFSHKVYILELCSLELEYVYEPCQSSIRALHMSHDNRFIFVGLASGIVCVLATYYWRQ